MFAYITLYSPPQSYCPNFTCTFKPQFGPINYKIFPVALSVKSDHYFGYMITPILDRNAPQKGEKKKKKKEKKKKKRRGDYSSTQRVCYLLSPRFTEY
jgi:hypothetical protein